MTLADLIAAYDQWSQGNRELMGKVPGLLPLLDATSDIAETPGVGMAIPATGMGGMPIKERLSVLMENPEYFRTPLLSRLAMLKGIRTGEVSPSVGRSTERLRELVGKAQATYPQVGGHVSGGGIKPPSEVLRHQDWVSRLLHGVKR